jgi:hypothetical protein
MGEMTDHEASEVQKLLVKLGLAKDMDDAAHQMVDAGEIGSIQHEHLLSDEERRRVYGD